MKFSEQLEHALKVATTRRLLHDCRKLLASYGAAHAGGMTLTEWHRNRIELMERIAEVLK